MNTSEMRTFRKRKRMSQDKLAQAIGVNRQTIVAWETSRNPPKDRTRVLELAHVLDLDERETNILLATAFLGPLPAWHLPYLRNPYFTGREDVLQQLHDTLSASKATALTQRQAISGLGGVGKTQIAVEYAYRYRDTYQGVFWVHAATRQDIIASFLGFAESFRLSELGEQDMILAAVKQWFATHDKWLLIFDNADDLTLVEEFLPTNDRGYILLTTRDQALVLVCIAKWMNWLDKGV
jgi:DNA-binding XRE family transcriptional regulator